MKKLSCFLVSCFILLLFAGFDSKQKPVIIQGTVTDKQGGHALENVHVYIVHGEEEAMTGANGRYRITTWQDFPVKIYAEAAGFRKSAQVVQRNALIQNIQLVKK